ncbi:MAG: family 2A encapsulin nanocompartment cargo protein cysteine desulfurase, partial [Terracidiphilus sp.]
LAAGAMRPATPIPISAHPSSPPSGQLTESDLRAIPNSLTAALGLGSNVPGMNLKPTVQSVDSMDGAHAPGLPTASATLPATAMFSFPAVPSLPTSAAADPVSGYGHGAIPAEQAGAPAALGSSPYIVDAGNAAYPEAPLAMPPVFPSLTELYSFPSVPAMPNASGAKSIPSLSGNQSALNIPASPSVPAAALPAGLGPGVPAIATPDVPGVNSEAATAVYPGVASSFPHASEMFSFPGVPGVQSPPGLQALPNWTPPKPSSEADVRAAVPPPNLPGSSSYLHGAEKAASEAGANTTAQPGVQPFEFRPDLAPGELKVAKRPFDARLIRRDFPILQEQVQGRPLIWLDSAATTQKPNAVIDRLSYFYQHENSNVHRAAHTLAARATDAYEGAREKVRRILNASSTREIIFVRGATEGINLVAKSWGHRYVEKDDEVVITWLEHHANIVPWQQLCAEKGARLRVAPVNDRGEIILEEYEKLMGSRTKIVAFSQVSNALGTITPAREMVEIAHRYGARVLVDGAQSVSHMPVDMAALDCDFFVFSGHKVFAPTGIGVVFGKADVLASMPPWQGGGNMIVDVTFEKTTYHAAPARFEAGTGNIADAVGLGAALDYVEEIGRESIEAYEHDLLNYATAGLLTVPGLRMIGTAREKAGVLSFVMDDVRTEDVGVALNQEGIAVRAGHHCAQPILRRMGVEGSVRASLALYNTCEDIDDLVAALLRLQAGRGHRKL